MTPTTLSDEQIAALLLKRYHHLRELHDNLEAPSERVEGLSEEDDETYLGESYTFWDLRGEFYDTEGAVSDQWHRIQGAVEGPRTWQEDIDELDRWLVDATAYLDAYETDRAEV